MSLLPQDGDSGSKRAKVDQDAGGEVPAEPDMGEHKAMDVDLNTEPTHLDIDASAITGRTEQGGVDQLPMEMHEMTIRDDKAHDKVDKVPIFLNLFDMFLVSCMQSPLRYAAVKI